MEKNENITINDVIALVKKAMEEGLKIYADIRIDYSTITVHKECDQSIFFEQTDDDGSLKIRTTGGYYKLPLNEKEQLQFKGLVIDCIEYRSKYLVKDFFNFLKNSKPKDINDLDNEDE